MPADLQAFIWVFGISIIGLLLGVVGFLIKDKLDAIMKEMKDFRADVIELFREDKAKVKAIEEIKGEVKRIEAKFNGDIKAIDERCDNRICQGGSE